VLTLPPMDVSSRRPRAAERTGSSAADAGTGPRSLGRAVTPATALLPLRAFLGVTFVYGGIQKLSDPGFLHAGSSSYIGTQLHGFAAGTPGGVILRAFATPHPRLAGVGVALVEIAVGLLTLTGLLTRVAAAVGLALNLLLFLSASWKTSPYFLGSDIVFVFAWLPFVLAGAGGQPALDHRLAGRAAPRAATRGRPEPAGALNRRQALARALGATGVATLAIAGIASLLKGHYRGGSAVSSLRGSGPQRASHHRTQTQGGRARVPTGAVRLGPSGSLAPNHGALYRDPTTGSADVVVRQADGALSAMSAICTHAGCEVQYDGRALICPCHGSVFSARTGAVEQGPASIPLALRRVVERNGQLYAVPS
jgi:thiosulfate dehydrogenase (quinone) large subunit